MKINKQTKEKEQKKTKTSATYKVKDINIQKMLEYLKKQNNNEQ